MDTAIVCGPQPPAGYEGLLSLAGRMPIRRVLAPVLVDDPARFVEALGDPYLQRCAEEGEPWAVRYREAYAALQQGLAARGIGLELLHAGSLARWKGFEVRRLRLPDRWPQRFVTSARTALVEMRIADWRWLIVTESLPEAVDSVLDADGTCDVLVLPDLSSRRSYRALIDRLAERTRPRLVIFCGDRVPRDIDIEAWAGRHNAPWTLVTGRDGAVRAALHSGGLLVRTWTTGKRIVLPPRAAD